MIVFITGSPLAGKTTVARQYAEKWGAVYISTGDIARELAKKDQYVSADLKEGRLSSNEVNMRCEIVHVIRDAENVVVEGFPRYTEQMYWLIEQCNKLNKSYCVVCLEVPYGIVQERLRIRQRDDDNLRTFKLRWITWQTLGFAMVARMESFVCFKQIKVHENSLLEDTIIQISEHCADIQYRHGFLKEQVLIKKTNKVILQYNKSIIYDDLSKSNLDAHLTGGGQVSAQKLWYIVERISDAIMSITGAKHQINDLTVEVLVVRRMISGILAEASGEDASFAPLARSWLIYSEAHKLSRDTDSDAFVNMLKADAGTRKILLDIVISVNEMAEVDALFGIITDIVGIKNLRLVVTGVKKNG